MNIEQTILSNLVFNEQYCRKVIPFIKNEYFTSKGCSILFNEIHDYVSQYNSLPSKTALSIECDNRNDLTEENYKEIQNSINELTDEDHDIDWLVNTTETWCQERAIYLSLMESIKIADGQDTKKEKGAIPQILSDALSVYNRNYFAKRSVCHMFIYISIYIYIYTYHGLWLRQSHNT